MVLSKPKYSTKLFFSLFVNWFHSLILSCFLGTVTIVVAKKRNYQKMAASSSNPTPPQENNQQNPEELCSANELSSEHGNIYLSRYKYYTVNIVFSLLIANLFNSARSFQKKGRGAAVGDQGHGMEAEIYQNRYVDRAK